MANEDIRKKAKENGIKLWQIADVYGVTDGNFSRKLRHELPTKEKEIVLRIIDTLKELNEYV